MRIFVISNGYPTKQSPQRGCFERDQAEALAALKHEVVMLSYDGRFRWFWRKLGVTTIRQNNVVSIDIFLLPNAVVKFFGIKAYQRFKHWQMDYVYKRAVKQFGRPDILYSHFLPNTSNAVFLKEKYGLPLVAMEHWSELAKETIRPFYFQMGKEAYPKVDKLLCVSPALSQRLNETFGVQSEIVPNIVGREFVYNPDISRYSFFTIVSVGSLIRRKRLDIAIESFNTVRKKHPCQLLIVGEGPERQNIQAQVQRLRLSESVKLLGRKSKSEIAKIYQQSHALLLSSELETFSVVCIEAMACGLPVVATQCGGPESFVLPQDGLLCPVGDADAMSDALDRLIINYDQYNPQEIADSCQQRFGPATIARQLTRIFEKSPL